MGCTYDYDFVAASKAWEECEEQDDYTGLRRQAINNYQKSKKKLSFLRNNFFNSAKISVSINEPTVSIQPILPIEPSGLQAYRPITTYKSRHLPIDTYISRG